MTASPARGEGVRPRTDKRAYYHLFVAQALSLVSTGVATVALALLAFDLEGGDAGIVIGTALAIKVAANVVVAPVAAAFVEFLPRRRLFAALLIARAACALAMLFVTSVGQVYGLILAFQIASAVFTPAYLATVPEVLPREQDYALALARARLAYELEAVVSPLVAAALLLVISDRGLFVTTAAMLLLATGLLLRVRLPIAARAERRPVAERVARGARIFLATPRLRGLVALQLAAAAAVAMVTVNTVVIVQQRFGLDERATAIALALFGAGTVLGALVLPRLLERRTNRTVMLAGGAIVTASLLAGAVASLFVAGVVDALAVMGALWLVLGFGCALAEVPYGTLLRRSGDAEVRQSLYATNFALANLCRLVAYPVAGTFGAVAGIPAAFGLLAGIAGAAVLAATALWPRADGWTTRALQADGDRLELVSEELR